MVDETQETTTIRIRVKTHDKLKELAKYGETMDDVVNRLMFVKRTGQDADETELGKKVERLV